MKRTMFNEPRPKGHLEMIHAMDESEWEAGDCNAELTFEPTDDGFGNKGWTAEVRENEGGEDVFMSLAYDKQDDLIADLIALGIAEGDINILEDE